FQRGTPAPAGELSASPDLVLPGGSYPGGGGAAARLDAGSGEGTLGTGKGKVTPPAGDKRTDTVSRAGSVRNVACGGAGGRAAGRIPCLDVPGGRDVCYECRRRRDDGCG